MLGNAAASDWRQCGEGLIKVTGVTVQPERVEAGAPTAFVLETTSSATVSSGTLDVAVKYMGFHVYSKSGPICDAVPCPLEEGPQTLTFNQEMPSTAPPGSYTMVLKATSEEEDELFCVEIDFSVHWGANAAGGMLAGLFGGSSKSLGAGSSSRSIQTVEADEDI
ncbi:hypothetical protein N2152v2_005555 [Parachlorella kessleri]